MFLTNGVKHLILIQFVKTCIGITLFTEESLRIDIK